MRGGDVCALVRVSLFMKMRHGLLEADARVQHYRHEQLSMGLCGNSKFGIQWYCYSGVVLALKICRCIVCAVVYTLSPARMPAMSAGEPGATAVTCDTEKGDAQ